MIKLEVEDYCCDCLDFTPDVEKIKFNSESLDGQFIESFPPTTTIRCEKRNRCKAIVRYLKKTMNDDENHENHENSTDERSKNGKE